MQEAAMPKLKTIYDTPEEIPEGFVDLYAERGGKMELVGIEGVRTQGDVDRVQEALKKERTDHRVSKEQLLRFADINPDEVHEKLDQFDSMKAQLEAFTKDGKIDETKLEPVIQSRVKAALGPVERNAAQLARALEDQKKLTVDALKVGDDLKSTLKRGSVERAIRDEAVKLKLIPTAVDDAIMAGLDVLDVADDGAIVTKERPGVVPGIGAGDWLKDMQDKRPHWWPQSQGGGAGAGGRGGIPNRADNPWSKEGWNLTKQGQLVRQDAAKAAEIAKSVGSSIGATHATAPSK
jgi:hypothetical protein